MNSPAAALDGLHGRVTRKLLPLRLPGYVAAYLDRVNVGFAKLLAQDGHAAGKGAPSEAFAGPPVWGLHA